MIDIKIKIILAIVVIYGFCFKANCQNNTIIPNDIIISHDGGEVAREGRVYSYANINNNDTLFWGFDITDTNIACINGNSKPPFECKNYFTDSIEIVGNTAYLYAETLVRYISKNELKERPVKARLILTATSLKQDEINFVKSTNMLYLALDRDFNVSVKIELLGPTDCKWRNDADSIMYSGKWASALDVFDAMPTDPNYLIFTSFDGDYSFIINE